MADTVLTRYGRDTNAVFDRLDEHCAGQAEQSFGGQDPRLANPPKPSRSYCPGSQNPVPQPNNYQPRTIRAAWKLTHITDEPYKHAHLEVPNAS